MWREVARVLPWMAAVWPSPKVEDPRTYVATVQCDMTQYVMNMIRYASCNMLMCTRLINVPVCPEKKKYIGNTGDMLIEGGDGDQVIR